ncbi:MAG: type II toxin-antitoxin system RelE/ParE family toxin [Bacteroidota bacterium]
MDCKIILSKAAIHEVQTSYQWYEERSLGLGKQFINFLDVTIKFITLNPEGSPIKVSSYREIHFSKFPYLIVYEYLKEEKFIYILHIFHTKRSPTDKYKRK